MTKPRHPRTFVTVFWPLRKVRGLDLLTLDADDRRGPCSSWGPPRRRATLRIERGRARGIYTDHKLPADVAALLDEEELELDRIHEEWQAATNRIGRIEREFIASLPAPRRVTLKDGTIWTFTGPHRTARHRP